MMEFGFTCQCHTFPFLQVAFLKKTKLLVNLLRALSVAYDFRPEALVAYKPVAYKKNVYGHFFTTQTFNKQDYCINVYSVF